MQKARELLQLPAFGHRIKKEVVLIKKICTANSKRLTSNSALPYKIVRHDGSNTLPIAKLIFNLIFQIYFGPFPIRPVSS